jgi:PEGA domain
MNMRAGLLGCTAALFLAGGCVERTLSVQSDPPGALVYLNDQEIGRTPMEHDFVWYGKYEVALRMEGYEALKTTADVSMPIYQLPPIDLLAEIVPITIKDRKSLHYTLEPLAGPEDTGALIDRAKVAKSQLESSHQHPATQP